MIGAIVAGVLLTISLFQTTINTDIFTGWIEQDLIPKLPPNSVVVMDNATFHKGALMQQMLEEAGHIASLFNFCYNFREEVIGVLKSV